MILVEPGSNWSNNEKGGKRMLFYFKVTTLWRGNTLAMHTSLEPELKPRRGTGQYLEIEAANRTSAIRKHEAGPKGNRKSNAILKFVNF